MVANVFEDTSHGGVVESPEASGVRAGQHEESGIRYFILGFEEDVGGLPWCDEDNVRGKWLDVDRVRIDRSQCMVGDTEKEIVVECSVDYAQEIRLSRSHF